ncbi:ABC transporter ATP-binding protein [Brevibacterium album]|uniref:ABC transporter ATP-binding protein n=1 Tax=Brevibacterium album TaxID=417948 RepID=UPI0003F4D165|nr:ABC transporter ATP-binding protein [Brevibacterium album]
MNGNPEAAHTADASSAPGHGATARRRTPGHGGTPAIPSPAPRNRDSDTRWSTARWLLARTRGLLFPLVLSALARISAQLLGIGLLVIAASALIAAFEGRGVHAGGLGGLLVVMALAKAGLRYAEHYAGHWVAFTALQRLRELFFSRLIPQAPAATKGRAGAALTETATRDIDRVEVFFAHTFPPAVSAVLVPLAALLWLGAAAEAGLAWLLVPFAVVSLVLPLLSARTVWRAARRVAECRGEVAAHIGDDVAGVREVLMSGAQGTRLRSLDAAGRALTRERSGSGAVEGLRAGLLDLLQAGALVTVVAVGVQTGAGAEAILLALAVAVGLRGPVRGIDGFAAGLDAALASAERLRAVTEAPPAVVDPAAVGQSVVNAPAGSAPSVLTAPPPAEGLSARATPSATAGLPALATPSATAGLSTSDEPSPSDDPLPSVEFRGVSFSYGSRPVLHDVSLRLPGGEWSCLAGVSGGGKSSLAALLLRDWDPAEGTVLLGGVDVARLPLDVLRSRVALVDQRPTLLTDTVGANVRLAAPEAPDAAVMDVLAAVGLDEWAQTLPRGLETPLAAGRSQVSGGQLQRLALARALLAEPEVLVLDEALSQLDGETAAHVRAQLRRLRPGGTTLEITHRVDLIEPDVHVAVLDAGRLVESGPAGELRGRGGAFDRLLARTV